MQITNYVRKCKNKKDTSRYDTLHAADNIRTFCGKELDETWFVESAFGLSHEDITCKDCLKIMRNSP